VDNPNPTSAPPGLALLILDMQDTVLRPFPAAGAPLVRRCAFTAASARLMEIPIALTEQAPSKLGGTNAAVRAAAGLEAPVFAKTAFSGFASAELGEWLRDRGTAHLLIAGIETPICVYLTVLGALAAEFEVTVLTDATGGRRVEDLPPAWRMIEQAGARLLPSETVFYSILSDSAHPHFRAFTALVKQYAG